MANNPRSAIYSASIIIIGNDHDSPQRFAPGPIYIYIQMYPGRPLHQKTGAGFTLAPV
jgi:hypothetical protein